MRIEELLAQWLPRQRWFAGKGRGVLATSIVADTELLGGDPALRHLIVTVHHDDGEDRYQLLLGVRSWEPDRLRHVEIGWAEGAGYAGWTYDAAHDADLTRVLLEGMAGDRDAGTVRFHRVGREPLETGRPSLVIGAEQSNTSFVFGEAYICKLFRRLSPGPNPDLEISLALAGLGSSHVARPYGWMEAALDGEPTTLAILSRYLRAATDGWTLAATSVRDLYAVETLRPDQAGGDFAGEADRLGAATAEVHRDLAEAFPTGELAPEELEQLAEGMRERLARAQSAVPALARYADAIAPAFAELAKLGEALPVQRVHGDYHLGQVLRTSQGWVILDFEGEPARPLAERRALASPLRDVAGMLRSFEYAARHQLVGHPRGPDLAQRAAQWARRNREAFCAGYARAGGADPHAHGVALRAFELDKAVYEVLYEARHRPAWLRIPLDSIAIALGY